ncbi:hypothetical protein J4460_02470 [Candidatus Woesearchaeota archaeon]|nr:MAG: hypothetical protein QS99_C0004G0056 [archaeon GW2011_AR4]MBS3129514.1 hypothetical protein [Candidatus Woesearchaeota archaeon]HIH38895.1 hypothetical protein [Candidatus Woesearchaeota archaeon]HIH48301.1 hypothetical protein [Candidatus Woesearchaeota archaeon]HIJ03801.1 hypothetical protein [Candidatus Woesearchaeota archaeon]
MEVPEIRIHPEPDHFFSCAVRRASSRFDRAPIASSAAPLLLPQSVYGRVAAGFTDRRNLAHQYPNTTIEQVMEALGRDVEEEHDQREHILQEV